MSKASYKISHIHIAGQDVEIHHKPIKHLYLKVLNSAGAIVVSAPKHFSIRHIEEFVLSKQNWIVKQQAKAQLLQQNKAVELDPSVVCLYGQVYPLEIIQSESHTKSHKIIQQGEKIYLYVKPSILAEHYGKLVDSWYRQQLQQQFSPIISRYEAPMSVNVKECRIKKMKTRWGSCNPVAQRIWLNLELVKKPLICLEYVIVHEMVHLLEASHNQRFYRLMDQYMPDWRSHKQLLNQFS